MSTAVLYRYMASAVSYNRCATHERSSGPFCPGLPVSPPCVSRLSASTSGPFLMNGQRHLRQRRRRPINRGMVHRFAKSLHHHDVLNVRHPSERRRCRHQVVVHRETGASVWTCREPKQNDSGQKRYAQTMHSVTPPLPTQRQSVKKC